MIRANMPGKIWPACDAPTQRLSKPRTNTSGSSSNLLSLSDQQSQPSSPIVPNEPALSGENATIIAAQNGERRSRRKSRSKIREYLHGQSSDDETIQKQKSSKRGVRERLSRSSSSLYHLTTGKSSTIQLSSPSSRELDNEHSELIRQEITHKAFTDSVAARNHVPEPVDEDKHPDAMRSPIRRRSLYTPGLATRSPDDLLRKPPQPGQEGEKHWYNMDEPSLSPLDNLAALASCRNAAIARTDNGRSTPTHFNQLGGLGLGTLRITNDTSSPEVNAPAPAHVQTPGFGYASHEDVEYYTASEGNRSEDDSSVLTMANVSTNVTPKPHERRGSPLKYEREWGTVASQRLPCSLPLDESDATQDNQALGSSQAQNGDYFLQPNQRSQSPDRAFVFAQDYMSELPPSPYKAAPRNTDSYHNSGEAAEGRSLPSAQVSTQDEATRASGTHVTRGDVWQTFVNDEAAGRHADSSTKEAAYRILNGEVAPRNLSQRPPNNRIDFSPGDRGSYDRYDSLSSNTLSRSQGSSGSERAINQTPDYKPSRANFYDSGYTSRDDIGQPLQGEPEVDHASNHYDRWSKQQSSISNLQEAPRQSLRGTVACADPSNDWSTADIVRPALEVVPRPQSAMTTWPHQAQLPLSQSSVPTVIHVFPNQYQSENATPSLATCSHESENGDRQVISDKQPSPPPEQLSPPPSEIFPTKFKKLQKARRIPKSSNVDMTATQELSNLTNLDIPIIPRGLVSKHAERLRNFPTLDHTYPNPQDEDLERSSSSSGEFHYVPIRFPSPTNSIDKRSSAIITADLSWPTRASKKKAKDDKIEQADKAKKLDSRKSQGDFSSATADFGTVANSLGKSPYDIARDPSKKRSVSPNNANRCHPHQMSSDMPRPKSMVGMDDAAAAEASHFRPDRRSSPHPDRPRTQAYSSSQHRNDSPGRGSRPQSMFVGEVPPVLDRFYSRDFPRDPGHQESGNNKSRSAAVQTPPVPELPSANETQHLEAMARRDHRENAPIVRTATSNNRPAKLIRPKSMYASTPPVPTLPPSQQVSLKHRPIEHEARDDQFSRTRTFSAMGPNSHATKFEPSTQSSPRTNVCTCKHGNEAMSLPSQSNPEKHERMIPILDPLPKVNKLKKRHPESAIPDIWKTDSLRDNSLKDNSFRDDPSTSDSTGNKVKRRTEDTPKRTSPQQKSDEQSDVDPESFTQVLADRRSAGDFLHVGGKRPTTRLSQPVAAPSLHDALRVQKEKRSKFIDISPMISSANTPKDVSRSPVSPLSMMHDDPSFAANQESYFPLAPTRKAPPTPPKGDNGTSTPRSLNRLSCPVTEWDGLPVGDFEVAYDQCRTAGGESNEKKQGWLRRGNPSPSPSLPKTPKQRTSLDPSPPKGSTPTISNPTANIADSYNSHAEASPAPPAFSVARKRVSSINCFSPKPSARSLKPVRPVSGPVSTTDTSRRESFISASVSSQYNTAETTAVPTTLPTPSASKVSLPALAHQSNNSLSKNTSSSSSSNEQQATSTPTKKSANSSSTHLSTPPKSSSSASTSAPIPPIQAPLYPLPLREPLRPLPGRAGVWL
ncbi:hypothetical protein G7Y79_00011g030960 [Physcia stellaris]|nr:hypothetical protein G7Y79_00011g030960 [Physcia stellaris]